MPDAAADEEPNVAAQRKPNEDPNRLAHRTGRLRRHRVGAVRPSGQRSVRVRRRYVLLQAVLLRGGMGVRRPRRFAVQRLLSGANKGTDERADRGADESTDIISDALANRSADVAPDTRSDIAAHNVAHLPRCLLAGRCGKLRPCTRRVQQRRHGRDCQMLVPSRLRL